MDKFYDIDRRERVFILLAAVAVLALIYGAWETLRGREFEEEIPDPDAPVDPFAGGFPVPAMPGQKLLRSSGPAGGRAVGQPVQGSTGTPALEEVHGG